MAGAIFIAPFFFLSGIGGEIADRFDKAVVARSVKLAELAATVVAAIGFGLHSIPVLMTSLGLFGVLAALFGPVKYGILPDHLKTSELPSGNALIEGATFLAILIGTTAGTKAAVEIANPWVVSVGLVLVAVACWGAAMFIPGTGSRAEGLRINPNVLASTWDLIAAVRADQRLWSATLIANWFWAFGAVVLSLMPTLVRQRLGGDENQKSAQNSKGFIASTKREGCRLVSMAPRSKSPASLPQQSHPCLVSRANSSRYGPPTRRSIRSLTHSGFRLCSRRLSTTRRRTSLARRRGFPRVAIRHCSGFARVQYPSPVKKSASCLAFAFSFTQ